MLDTYENRTAKLAVSENSKTSLLDISVEIEIVHTLPMLSINSGLVANNMIVEKETLTALANLDLVNTLTDAGYLATNGVERFTFITQAQSAISKNYVRLYYDAKYEDIIVMPEIAYLSPTLPNRHYKLRGYRIGGGTTARNATMTDMVLPLNSKFALPVTKSNITNTAKFIRLHGINTHANARSRYDIAVGVAYTDSKLLPTGLIHLGAAADLFVTPAAMPVYTVYQATPDRYEFAHLGHAIPESIYIPLNF